jgi:hypothetical protein
VTRVRRVHTLGPASARRSGTNGRGASGGATRHATPTAPSTALCHLFALTPAECWPPAGSPTMSAKELAAVPPELSRRLLSAPSRGG